VANIYGGLNNNPLAPFVGHVLYFYPPSQKNTSLPVVECVIDRLLWRDVAHNLGG